MTKERMGEIALLMIKAALRGDDDIRRVEDVDLEEISLDTGILVEEAREFMEEVFKEVGKERAKK